MPQEVRVFAEGTIRWVQASGTGVWATASAPASGLMGFVQPGLKFTVGETYATVSDRGVPKHHKLLGTEPIEGNFTVFSQATADWPRPATGSGTTTRAVHLEYKQAAPEGTPIYGMFINAILLPATLTEAAEGNTYEFPFRAISAIWPTASGYLG